MDTAGILLVAGVEFGMPGLPQHPKRPPRASMAPTRQPVATQAEPAELGKPEQRRPPQARTGSMQSCCWPLWIQISPQRQHEGLPLHRFSFSLPSSHSFPQRTAMHHRWKACARAPWQRCAPLHCTAHAPDRCQRPAISAGLRPIRTPCSCRCTCCGPNTLSRPWPVVGRQASTPQEEPADAIAGMQGRMSLAPSKLPPLRLNLLQAPQEQQDPNAQPRAAPLSARGLGGSQFAGAFGVSAEASEGWQTDRPLRRPQVCKAAESGPPRLAPVVKETWSPVT